MREIKFRAWVETDDSEAEMMYFDKFEFDNGLWFSSNKHVDKYHAIMQYTGLKDKNGKEIYEGDILRGSKYPFISEGKENYYALIQWSEDNAGFYSYPIICSDRVRGGACEDHVFEDGQNSAKTFEIIGNIYENPELIKL